MFILLEPLRNLAREHWRLAVGVTACLALRATLLVRGAVPFNADEAVVALMARHILRGERPFFFYGQAYMGSLEAWYIAAFFRLFGESVMVLRMAEIVLYLLIMLAAYVLARRLAAGGVERARLSGVTAWLLAVPPVLVFLYTNATLGAYNFAALLGLAVILLGVRLPPRPAWRWFMWGILAGAGFWTMSLTLLYVAPVAAWWLWRLREADRQGTLIMAGGVVGGAGFALGSAPWWLAGLAGQPVIAELGGAPMPAEPHFSLLGGIGGRLFNLFFFHLPALAGARAPWSATYIVIPLVPLVLAAYGGAFVVAFRRMSAAAHAANSAYWVALVTPPLLLAGALVITPFGADPTGRYLVPMYPLVAIMLALLTEQLLRVEWGEGRGRWRLAWLVLALLVGYNLFGVLEAANRQPPGITTQFDAVTQIDHSYDAQLVTFLREHGETRGYANYWIAYPLAFLSGEELIYEARLPYHLDFSYTPRDSRYAPYTQAVAASPRVAYITSNFPLLDERIRTSLFARGVTFVETQIGDYHVIYNLSRKVTPDELDYGLDSGLE